MTALKIVFDTNAFYACEDIRVGHQHANAGIATELKELALTEGCELFLHPATEADIRRTTSQSLIDATMMKFRQWRRLDQIPPDIDLAARAGYLQPMSDNDLVDLAMLGALECNAVDLLVTEDGSLRNHATQAGLGNATLSILGAIDYLNRLYGNTVSLPTVYSRKAYAIPRDDPLFESLRTDYENFDFWWEKVSKDHRPCRTVEDVSGRLQALAVLKLEEDHQLGFSGEVVKLCTFKVAPEAEGAKRGELVLKAVFQYAKENRAAGVYVTVFEHHQSLLALLEVFGFTALEMRTELGELVMVKRWEPPLPASTYSPLDYNRLFGPGAVIVDRAFVVPIKPYWYDTLFPEVRSQGRLFAEEPSGNAMLKAYLCRASTRQLAEGDVLVFYQSQNLKAAAAIGVVERTLASTDPAVIRRFVSTRTVYPDSQIQEMCSGGEVLAILFRHDRALTEPWPLAQLIAEGVLTAAPQSIQQVDNERGYPWLRKQLNDPR